KKLGGVAWIGPDRFAVVNTRNDLLAIVDPKGKPERVFAASGKGDGELDDPQGIAASSRRRLYIADEGNNRVVVFSEYGVFLQAFGVSKDQNFALVKPVQVAVDAAERVYVLEHSGPGRITVYDRNGKQLRRLTPQAVGAADARWKAITVDLAGRLFVADGANSNVTVLDWEKGVALRKFGSPGRGRGQFGEIAALAIAGRDLAVADVGNKKIEFFRMPEAPAAVAAIDLLPSVRRTSVTALECGRVYSFIDGDLL